MILEKCNSSWGKPSDYNYIMEFQEEFILQKLHLQLHFLSVRNLNCNHVGADSNQGKINQGIPPKNQPWKRPNLLKKGG